MIQEKLLQYGPATIRFRKKDGTRRVMRATLSRRGIPARAYDKYRQTGQPRQGFVQVWDLQNNAWRQIDLSRIERFEVGL